MKDKDQQLLWEAYLTDGALDEASENTDKHGDHFPSTTRPGEEMRMNFTIDAAESEGGPTFTKNINDPRLRAHFRETTYNSMKHELPRRYRKGVTFFQLPNKVKKYIDQATSRGLEEMERYTAKLKSENEDQLPEGWMGYDTGMLPKGTEFHPIDPSDYSDADEEFNTSLAGAAQRKPAFLDNPAIYPPKKVGNVTIVPKKK